MLPIGYVFILLKHFARGVERFSWKGCEKRASELAVLDRLERFDSINMQNLVRHSELGRFAGHCKR